MEKLRLLTKAEKAGLLSAAKRAGLSLAAVERLVLLSKAEELGVLSATTDQGTPSALQGLTLLLLAVGLAVVYLVPEQYPWEVAVQAVAALVCVSGGSAAFTASSFASMLQIWTASRELRSEVNGTAVGHEGDDGARTMLEGELGSRTAGDDAVAGDTWYHGWCPRRRRSEERRSNLALLPMR